MQFSDEAFESLINRYFKTLFKIAYNYVLNSNGAEDIVQEVFMKCYKVRNTFKDEEHLKYWLIRVTINQSINCIKHNKKETLLDFNHISNLPDIKENNNDTEDIYILLNQLKETYKTILLLYYYDNYSIKEIANILNISETNVTTRLERARIKLKTIINERENHNGER